MQSSASKEAVFLFINIIQLEALYIFVHIIQILNQGQHN